jgi:hypothetical protein
MARKTKITFQGQQRDAEVIEINQSSERWNEYLLEDGTVLKLKPVATEVVKLSEVHDNEGNPVYLIKTHNVVSVIAPENLKRKPFQE